MKFDLLGMIDEGIVVIAAAALVVITSPVWIPALFVGALWRALKGGRP